MIKLNILDETFVERTVTELRCTEREYKDVLKTVEVSHKDEIEQVEIVETTIDNLQFIQFAI